MNRVATRRHGARLAVQGGGTLPVCAGRRVPGDTRGGQREGDERRRVNPKPAADSKDLPYRWE